jgi:hypothetical protein
VIWPLEVRVADGSSVVDEVVLRRRWSSPEPASEPGSVPQAPLLGSVQSVAQRGAAR